MQHGRLDEPYLGACAAVPDNPDSRGFLRTRGQASHELLDSEHRVLYPKPRRTFPLLSIVPVVAQNTHAGTSRSMPGEWRLFSLVS